MENTNEEIDEIWKSSIRRMMLYIIANKPNVDLRLLNVVFDSGINEAKEEIEREENEKRKKD